MSTDSPESFYDALASDYHLIFADWDASMARQAAALNTIIEQTWGVGQGRTVLDAACGIGTQALGLAGLGYRVTGSDVSAQEIERAQREAAARSVELELVVADIRELPAAFPNRQFDVVLACDNAVPHLLSDADLLEAFRACYVCTRPGGGCLISVRDYAQEPGEGITIKPIGVRQEGDTRFVISQVWEYVSASPAIYELALYITGDTRGDCTTRVMRSKYYAVTIPTLMTLMTRAGFKEVARIDRVFYQPVLVGKKPR